MFKICNEVIHAQVDKGWKEWGKGSEREGEKEREREGGRGREGERDRQTETQRVRERKTHILYLNNQ